MSLQMNVQVIGEVDLLKALKELGAAAGQKGGPVKAALMAAALPVLRAAQEKVPVDTGRLRGAIKRRRHPNPKYLNEIVGIGVDPGRNRDDLRGAWYGNFVEYGTTKKSARPFLRPALEQNRTKSVAIFGRKLGAGIEKIARAIGNKNAQAVGAKAKRAAAWTDRVVSGPVEKPFTYRGPLKSPIGS